MLSSATEPYLQLEEESQVTRRILEVIAAHRFPLHLITRSHRVLRDRDLVKKIGEGAILPTDLSGKLSTGAFVTFSFSSLDDEVAKVFEPGATAPSHRLVALREIAKAGIHTGVSLMPLLPWISDTTESLHRMYAAFREAGAAYVFPAGLTLFGNEPHASRTLVFRAIKKHYPHLTERYEKLFAGSDYLPSAYSQALEEKARSLSEQYGLHASILP